MSEFCPGQRVLCIDGKTDLVLHRGDPHVTSDPPTRREHRSALRSGQIPRTRDPQGRDERQRTSQFVNEVPIEGEVYTVRFIRNGPETITGKYGPALALEEITGWLPGCKNEVCWIVRRFVPLDVAETNSVAKKKKSVAKRKRSPQPRRKMIEPALV